MRAMRDACSCGATIFLAGGVTDEAVMSRWQQDHSGAGHVSVTPNEARYVRNGYKVPAGIGER